MCPSAASATPRCGASASWRAPASIPLYQAAREIVETEELTGKARKSLADLIAAFERWRGQIDGMKHTELAELILDESGYTQMWQHDKSPQAHSRLENLKELDPLHARVRDAAGLPGARLARHGRRHSRTAASASR